MRVNAGKAGLWWDSGKGKIWCAHAPEHGIEQKLLDITIAMVDANGFAIVISSVDTGVHVPTSRHKTGRAEDVSDVHRYGQEPQPATLANPHAVAAVQWFIDHGFVAGRENGPYNSVLFGPVGTKWNRTKVPHDTHFHASIWRG
jgi:hypothetical protein